MRRSLALLVVLAGLAIAAVFLSEHERQRGSAATAAEARTETPAAAKKTELAEPELAPTALARDETRAPPSERERRSNAELAVPRWPGPDDGSTVLVFRALDTDGEPVIGKLTRTTITGWRRGFYSQGGPATTDGQGVFEVPIDPSTFVDGGVRALEVTARNGTLSARVDLDRVFPPGRIDMGDIVLSPAPLIAEGRVVDAAGGPVARASLGAYRADEEADGERTLEVGPLLATTTTGRDGAFALRGTTGAARAWITLDHKRMRAAPLKVAVGSRALEIVAQASGGVAGRVLIDPGVPSTALKACLRPEDSADDARTRLPDAPGSSARKNVGGDGTFQLDGLLPGRFTFSVEVASGVLTEVHGIEVRSGEIERDERLQALDLRGRLHVFTLELVAPSPEVALGGGLSYTASGTSSAETLLYFERGPVQFVTPLAAIDVVLQVKGCRTERLFAVRERTEVRLRSALSVRLVLPPEILLPVPPLFVGAELENPGDRWTQRSLSTADETPPLDERGEALLRVSTPGRWTVRWFVERHVGGASDRSVLDLGSEQIVFVEDRDDEQRIVLEVTKAALAAALVDRER